MTQPLQIRFMSITQVKMH